MTDHEDRKRVLIRQLVQARRGEDLRQIALGVSKYCRSENDRKVVYSPATHPSGLHPASLAFMHLEFTSRYGADALQAKERGRLWFAYPQEFELWLEQGAPGLFLEELEAYVAENPIES